MKKLVTLSAALVGSALFLACAATGSRPVGPAEDVASEILVALDAGRESDADELFGRTAKDGDKREKVYPILFDTARQRYDGDPAGAARILRFMAQHYERATAVQEALLYSLFLERAGQATPESSLVEEIGVVLASVRRDVAGDSAWVDLIDAQRSIDTGDLPEARVALDQFLAAWDGAPSSLGLYVDDIDRYLRSH